MHWHNMIFNCFKSCPPILFFKKIFGVGFILFACASGNNFQRDFFSYSNSNTILVSDVIRAFNVDNGPLANFDESKKSRCDYFYKSDYLNTTYENIGYTNLVMIDDTNTDKIESYASLIVSLATIPTSILFVTLFSFFKDKN